MRVPCLFLILAVGLPAHAGDKEEAALDYHLWSDAHKIATPHFFVRTNTSREIGEALAATLEQAYPLFEHRFGALPAGGQKMRMHFFRNAPDYMNYGAGIRGAVGHFDAALDRTAVIWSRDLGEAGWPVAVHEASHHYLKRRHPHFVPPSWYGEGIACYFEGLQDKSIQNGAARMRYRIAMSALDIGDANLSLLLKSRAHVENGQLRIHNFRPARYYALAWSFVHYLATNKKTRRNFRRFEKRLFASRPAMHARQRHAQRILREECGPLSELEAGWHKHLRAMEAPEPITLAAVSSWELEADRVNTRYAALRRLQVGPLPEKLRAGVIAALSDKDIVVRSEAISVMARHPGPDVWAELLRSLEVPSLRLATLRALAHKSAGVAVPRLLRDRPDAPLVETLVAIGDKRSYPLLKRALLDERLPDATRAKCARALHGHDEARPELIAATWEAAPEIRDAASTALDAKQPVVMKPIESATLAALVGDATDVSDRTKRLLAIAAARWQKASFRARACNLLALTEKTPGSPEVIDTLRPLCDTRTPEMVRLAALRALVTITGETRGYRSGQRARERERVYRAWLASGQTAGAAKTDVEAGGDR
ncbi:MAG: hypothetical protein V3T86_16900 [Planctomycetota bacterium]